MMPCLVVPVTPMPLFHHSINSSSTAVAEASGNTYVATFVNLPLGYYVVSPQAGSTSNTRHTDAMLVNVTATTKNINLKSEYPTVDKTIDTDKKGDSAQIGSKVNFQLKSKVPDTSEYTNYVFKIVDALSAGLDFNNDVTVKVGDATLTATTDYSVTTKGKTVTIDLSNYVKTDNASKAGKGILVTYSATLNENAFVGTPDQNNSGNLNSAKVQYSNGPSEENIGESTPSETHSYTFNFNLKKIYKEGDTENALAGAKFQLLDSDKTAISLVKKSDNVYRPAKTSDTDKVTEVETPATGIIEFTGLKAGTYYLKETFAPKGYNKLSDPVEVTIKATINKTTGALESWTVNGSAPTADVTVPVVKIENKKGALLPDTGGMGTVLFTVFGVLIVALGAGWYVKSNRKSRHAA